MFRKLIIATILTLIPVSSFAQPAAPKDMIISAEALAQLGQEINEAPYKTAAPMIATLQHGLKPLPEAKTVESPKSPNSDKK